VASTRLTPEVGSGSLAKLRPKVEARPTTAWIDRDDIPLDAIGRTVFALLVVYVVMNRVVADRFVLPVGISIRPYEIVLLLLGLVWAVWLIVEPRPLPSNLVGLTGLLVFAVVGLAPFLHALNVNQYQANGAERGLFRLFAYTALLLAAFHMAFRLKIGLSLLAVVIAATIGQALFAIYEFVTARPVVFLDSLATGMGLIPDPRSIRIDHGGIVQRLTGEIRAVATAPHPIVLSAVIALGILIVGAWLVHTDNPKQRAWLAAAAGLLLLALPVSNSRTGFFIVALVAIPVLVLMSRNAVRVVLWTLPLFAVLTAGAVISPRTPRLILNSFLNPGNDPNTVVRFTRFSRIPDLLDDRPFIGAGYLTKDPALQIFDNAYNKWLIELGIIGLVLFLLFILASLVMCWRAARIAEPEERMLPVAGVIGILALLAGGATFDAWTFDQFFPTILILMGLGLGRSALILHRPNQDEPVLELSARL
jgi:O-antigen ligase